MREKRLQVRAALLVSAAATAACGALIGIDDRLPDEATVAADGGPDGVAPATDAGDITDRTVTVTVDWPTLAALDPLKDTRAAKVRIEVRDAADATRSASTEVTPDKPGPYTLTVRSTSRVDAIVSVRTATQVLGFGRRRGWDVAQDPNVPVAVRRRILYFASNDRGDQLRALGMTPTGAPEPALDETLPSLATLKTPTDLYITEDGKTIVESGIGATGKGALGLFSTGTHAKSGEIDVNFVIAGLARIGDGRRALAVPAHQGGDPATDTFAVVDIEGKKVTPIAAAPAGSAIDGRQVATSPDGSHAAAVGTITVGGGGTAPALFVYDAATDKVTLVELSKTTAPLADAQGVRFAQGGATLLVGGAVASGDAGWYTGKIVRFALDGAVVETVFSMDPDKTRPNGLLLHGDGTHLFVGDEVHYYSNTSCCGDTWLVDLAAKSATKIGPYGQSGPSYELTSGFHIPYEPGYSLAAQTDNGNNVHGPIVDITNPTAPGTVTLQGVNDIGSMLGATTPFADPL